MDTPDEIRENRFLDSIAPFFLDGRHCALCGNVWESSIMALDKDACEAYCRDCVEIGDVASYLQRCDYTPDMILTITKQIK